MTARNLRVASGAIAAFSALVLSGAVSPTRAAAAVPRVTHVGIVISQQQTACVSWHDGMTGADVLSAVTSVSRRRTDGLINKIGGLPTDGKVLPDYWAYWHNTGGGWAFSQVGADTYRPSAGSVEGWIYNDGSTPPPAVGYAAICSSADAAAVPPPAPTHTAPAPSRSSARPKPPPIKAVPASKPATSASAAASLSTASRSSAAPPALHPSSAATSTTSVASRTSATASGSATPLGAVSPPGTTPEPSIAAALASPLSLPATGGGGQHPGPFVGIGVGAAAIVVLGGASVGQRRRRAAGFGASDER
ncbi:MAG: hypothetical protein JWN95_1449 [Frankiales bacterium]|nr:hypothetical protein [Frankiales bacterium]